MEIQQRFFMAHHDDFVNNLNLDVLIPKLNSKEMLTFDEMELLNLCQTTQRKIQQFVQIMCRKGKRAPELFLQCLGSATEHLPHSDLADKMEWWLRKHSSSVERDEAPNTSQNLHSHCEPTAPPSDDPDLGPSSPTKPRLSPPGPQPAYVQSPPKGYKRPPPSTDMICPPSKWPLTSPPLPFRGLETTALTPPQTPTEFARQYIPQTFSEPSPHMHTELPELKSHPPPYLSSQVVSFSREDSPLQVLADTLRLTYSNIDFFKKASGPEHTMQYINLALIKKKKASKDDREKDEFLKSTLHGSVDDIVKKKEEIKLQKIFAYSEKKARKLVLVEGAPGVGKTMLALKLCQMWAKGELLNEEYDLVMLVTLRRFQGKSSVKLNDIVNISLEDTIADQCTQALFRSKGERVLIILEGWDELPPELREVGTFFFDIIECNKLPKASVLVTSRPTVTADLYDYMDERHIEVLGFNSEQITEYVKVHGKENTELIIRHLGKFPNIKALAHIPLTLSIICHVASTERDLPQTLTELYDRYICNTLLQNMKRQPSKKFKSLIGLSSLDELPDEVEKVIQSLSTLALSGLKKKKFVFSKEELVKVGLDLKTPADKSFDGFGLLNTPLNSTVAGFEQVFQFNHLSIQEFLAAYGIQQLQYEERVALLREFRIDKQFQNVWKFFSGITKLEDEDFRNIVIAETGKANKEQLFLLHCLYEANNPAISQDAAEKMHHFLNLNNMFLNTTDCLCAAHMITSAGGEWSVDLRGCNIGEEGLRIISTSLKSYLQSHDSHNFKITRFNLLQNRITAASISHLAELLASNIQVGELVLSSNPFGDKGVSALAGALKKNTTVTCLHFCRCNLTSAGATALAEVLKECNSTHIKELWFQQDSIGDHGVVNIARALENNSTVTELALTHVEMTSVGLNALTNMAEINQTLQVLRIDRNNFKTKDSQLLAAMISKNNSLELIDMSKNPFGNEGFEVILDALIAKPSSPLKKLGVFGCDLTPKGYQKLTTLFSVTKTFACIQMGCNEIGDEGAEILGNALLQNTSKSVTGLLLENTYISTEGKRKLQEVCDSINKDRNPDSEVKVTYENHSHLQKMRQSANHR